MGEVEREDPPGEQEDPGEEAAESQPSSGEVGSRPFPFDEEDEDVRPLLAITYLRVVVHAGGKEDTRLEEAPPEIQKVLDALIGRGLADVVGALRSDPGLGGWPDGQARRARDEAINDARELADELTVPQEARRVDRIVEIASRLGSRLTSLAQIVNAASKVLGAWKYVEPYIQQLVHHLNHLP